MVTSFPLTLFCLMCCSTRPSCGKMLRNRCCSGQVNPFYPFGAYYAVVCDVSTVANMNREEHRMKRKRRVTVFPEKSFFNMCGRARRFAFQKSKIRRLCIVSAISATLFKSMHFNAWLRLPVKQNGQWRGSQGAANGVAAK